MPEKKNTYSPENLIHFIDDGFLRADVDGIIVNANIAIAEMCGYDSPEEMIGLPMKSLYVNQVERDKMLEFINKKGKLTNYELALKTKAGKHFWSMSNIKVIRDENNTVIGTEGVIRNITERKQMEEELRSANQQLAATEEELRANNQQIAAIEQQLRATNQQLLASQDELKRSLAKSEKQRKANLVVLGDLNKATKLLKEERDKARLYLDIAGVMFIAIDTEHTVTLANAKASEILGFPEDEIVGKNWFDHFLPPQNASQTKAVFNKMMSGKLTPVEFFENPVKTKSGEERIIAWHNSVLKDKSGNIIGSLSSGEDVTEQRHVEENLRKTKELLDKAEKAARIGGWEFDVETMTQTWTKETFRIMEIDTEHGAPKVPEGVGFIDPPYRTMAEKAIQDAIQKGKPYDQEWLITTAKGNKRWVHSVAYAYKKNGKVISLSGSFQDITKQKNAEIALKESEEKFRTLVEKSLQGMVVAMNNPLRIAYASSPMENITGYSAEELETFRPEDLTKLIHPDDRESFFKAFADRVSGKDVDPTGIYRIVQKDGSVRIIELFSTLIHYNDEPATQTVFIDITDRKQAEDNLKEKISELERFNKVMVGRENRMIELKQEINELCEKLGLPPKYRSIE